MLAFHGFGQESAHFNQYAEVLEREYTIYSFDIFFHGNSTWKRRQEPLSKLIWKQMIQQFLNEHELNNFYLTGFSMGGKFALAIVEAFPDQVEKVILIAPDGIKTSFWYSLATYPGAFRNLFRYIVAKPKPFYTLVKIMKKARLVDKGVLKFAKSQMKTRQQRRKVYLSWVIFRCFYFDIGKVAQLINHHQIEVDMYLGKYDKIITEKNMQTLLMKLNSYSLKILESGHNTLIDDVARYIKNNKVLD